MTSTAPLLLTTERASGARIDTGNRPSGAGFQRILLALALPLAGMLCFALAVATTHQDDIGDLGLIQAASPWFFAAVAILGFAFALEITSARPRTWALAVQLGCIVVLLYAFPALVEQAPRIPTGWVHAGFVDYIARRGSTLPKFDARFNWPGAFAWAAVLLRTAGVSDQIELIRWTPLLLTTLYLVPLYRIVATFTDVVRWRWAALALFLVADWVAQDYYSPQGISYLLYLCLIALVLSCRPARAPDQTVLARFAAPPRRWVFGQTPEAELAGPVALRTTDTLGLLAVAVALIAAIVVGHQLTPVIAILSLAALAWYGHARSWSLAVLTAALFAAFLSFAAVGYWRGHLADLFGGVGAVGSNATGNVGARVTGSADHVLAVNVRIGFVAVFAVAVAAAAIFGPLPRSSRRVLALLSIVPFSIIAAQSYGGEGLLRSYFFALPFACALVASWLPTRRSMIAVGSVSVLAVVLASLLLVTRYGNDRFEAATTAELVGVRYALDHAPRGSSIVAVSEHFPWMFRGLEDHRWVRAGSALALHRTAAIRELERRSGAWVLITRSQEAYGEVAEGKPRGWGDRLARTLIASGRFRIAFRNADATVLVNSNPPPTDGFTPGIEDLP